MFLNSSMLTIAAGLGLSHRVSDYAPLLLVAAFIGAAIAWTVWRKGPS